VTGHGPRQREGVRGRRSTWALDVELRQLRALVVLAKAGSLSGAARALGVAQSTMSEAVAALERALGTRVVARRRGGHGVALTAAGEALLPYARGVLGSLEDAHVAVAAVDRGLRSEIEVIANESVSTYLLPPALAEVRSQWPRLRFLVSVGMCPSITEGLSSGRYDVGLMLQTERCPSVLEDAAHPRPEFLAEVPLVLFSAATHPLVSARGTRALGRGELKGYTLFISDARGYFHDLLREFFRSRGAFQPRLEATGSVEGVKQSVRAHRLGLGVLPSYAVVQEIRAGVLALLRVDPELPHMRLTAIAYRARPPVHPAVHALLEAVRHTVDEIQKTA
jgi:molybdate transport repressor ModE-like protein